MASTHTAVFPSKDGTDIGVRAWDSQDEVRLRLLDIGDVSVHINSDRSILDALQAALDAIRADFDAREPQPAEAAS